MLIIASTAKLSWVSDTRAFFYNPYVATEYGTREYTCQSVKFRSADALEWAGVASMRQPQPLKLMRYKSYVGGNSGRKPGNFAVGVLLGC